MKTDKELGKSINELLTKLEIETPVSKNNKYSEDEKMEHIRKSFHTVMTLLGLDLSDDSLQETPHRIAKMFTHEIFEGLNYDNFPKCTAVENKFHADEMIVVGDINVSSTCEHHFQNIEGFAKIAYIPNKKVLGLSKLNRIVRFFSKRPQIQERLTLQIKAALCYILETEDVAVEIRAIHHCVRARGIEDKNSWTTTRALGGVFKSRGVRNEFLNSK